MHILTFITAKLIFLQSTGKYSAIVVVTMNNLGIPGLVADGDRFFNITCDYTTSFRNKVTATGPNIAVKYMNFFLCSYIVLVTLFNVTVIHCWKLNFILMG